MNFVPPRTSGSTEPTRRDRVEALVGKLRARLHEFGLLALRIALGATFVWFGALKVAGGSPAAPLVVGVTPWPDPAWFVTALGVFEVVLGGWLMIGRWLVASLPLFTGHMVGTMSVFVFMPQVAFLNGNPLMLTMEGEFVAKNAVLLAAGIVVATRASRGVTRRSAGTMA